MSLGKLSWKNITRSAFRSGVVFFCAALLAGGVFTATLVIRGAVQSITASLDRLGADILVVPWGTFYQAEELQDLRITGVRTTYWLPQEIIQKLTALPGVAAASAQWYVTALEKTPYSPSGPIYLVAYDPETDFTLHPWLKLAGITPSRKGEVLIGSEVNAEIGQVISLARYDFNVINQLQPTKTEADQSVFFTFDTALDFSQWSNLSPQAKNHLLPGHVSSILLRVDRNHNTQEVINQILDSVERVKAIKSKDMFQAQRGQLLALTRSQLIILGILCVVATLFLALIFTISVNERKQEIGVLRALGAKKTFIMAALIFEGIILASSGGISGLFGALLILQVMQTRGLRLSGADFQIPSPQVIVGVAILGLAVALASVSLAALYPSLRIIRQEASIAMRE